MRSEIEVNASPLSRDEAVLLTNQITKALSLSWELIVRAYHGRAWEALEYSTWDAYCKGEFGHARLALPAEERDQQVRSLRAHGLSVRAIAAATGEPRATVGDALQRPGVRNRTPDNDDPTEVIGIDGKTYRQKPPEAEIIDAEIVGEDEDVADAPLRETRVPLPRQFRKPVTDLTRGARRIAELSDDDRMKRNTPIIAELYLAQLKTAQESLNDVIARLEKSNGAD